MYQYYPGFQQLTPYAQSTQNINGYQQNSLIRVTGAEGAKAYQMAPNSTAALFDANNDYMYIKSTDGAGFPTIRTFKFEEIGTQPAQISEEYVSKKEFEQFKGEVLNHVKQFIYKPEPENTNATDQGNDKRKRSEKGFL